MLSKYIRGKVYVFIDAANLESSVKSQGWRIAYKKLYSYLKEETNFMSIKFYSPHFKDKKQDNFLTLLRKTGYKINTKPLKIIETKHGQIRKANFDVEITLDMRNCIENYETVILFSGDSDFNYLIKYIKAKNKRVIIISSRYHISKELFENCHKYLDLSKIREHMERI